MVCMCEGPKSLHILYQSADYSLWSAMQIIFSGHLGSVGSRLFYLFIFFFYKYTVLLTGLLECVSIVAFIITAHKCTQYLVYSYLVRFPCFQRISFQNLFMELNAHV